VLNALKNKLSPDNKKTGNADAFAAIVKIANVLGYKRGRASVAIADDEVTALENELADF